MTAIAEQRRFIAQEQYTLYERSRTYRDEPAKQRQTTKTSTKKNSKDE